VNTWLASKASQHSTIASLESIGKTYEGRDMKVLKIGEAANKPAIWIDAALHAREWIASATLIYIADQLLNEYSSNANINKFTWYILPIANPDGYEYSYNYNRFWRKTRTRNAADYRGTCPGVDPNRNWGFHFGEAGTSNNPCSDIYRGETAFSEKCVFNMKTFLYNKRKQIKVYISFHSYGQMFMTPWGYTHTSAPSDIRELTRVANLAKTAIKNVNGKSYSVGSPGSLLYDAAGGSFDWAKGVAGIKYAYTLELRPADNTSGGFAIPASEILPTGRETYAAVKEVAKRVTV
ncbi:carboxypeptidase B-like, partial [Lingula anatina]|uniref:Carboxypeptidase B-like n=1 Tax=Lingula anatina TaxID=7574 RepID=A0A1S3I8L1_LINAN